MDPETSVMSYEALSTLQASTATSKMSFAETTPPSTRTGSPNRAGYLQVCPESPTRIMQEHARTTLGFLEKVSSLRDKGFVALNGDTLDVPGLVAVSK